MFLYQGSHFSGLTKFQDFFSKFPSIFFLYFKSNFQVVLSQYLKTIELHLNQNGPVLLYLKLKLSYPAFPLIKEDAVLFQTENTKLNTFYWLYHIFSSIFIKNHQIPDFFFRCTVIFQSFPGQVGTSPLDTLITVRAPLHLATAMTLRDRSEINYIDYALYCYIQHLRQRLPLNYLSLGDCFVSDSRAMSLRFWSRSRCM